MRPESLGYWKRHRIFPLLGRGQEPTVPVCSGSGELHSPLSGLGKVNGEGASRWHSWIHNVVSGFEGPQSLLACVAGMHNRAAFTCCRAGGQCCSKQSLGLVGPCFHSEQLIFLGLVGTRALKGCSDAALLVQWWLVSPPKLGVFWQQDGLHMAPGMLASDEVGCSCPVPSPETNSPAAVWCKKWPEMGLHAAGICSWWGEQWHSAFIRRQKGHTRTFECTLSTVSEGNVWALFLSQKSSLFLVHGTCQSSKD